MSKIVILSLGKSGTTSASIFFEKLGYKSIHYLGHTINFNKIRLGISQKEVIKMGEYLEKDYEVFSDYPYCMAYEYFDKKYENTKFILITRDSMDWAKSVQSWEGHWNSLTMASWEKYLNPTIQQFKKFFYKGDGLSNEQLQYLYSLHTKDVLEYFKDSKNFIHLDLYDKDIAIKILNFLNRSERIDFPKANTSIDPAV
jgi:hypothetical protein